MTEQPDQDRPGVVPGNMEALRLQRRLIEMQSVISSAILLLRAGLGEIDTEDGR